MKRYKGLILLALFVLVYVGFACNNTKTSDIEKCTEIPGEAEQNSYDVIVVGGEPEGIAAAVSAARNGLETLLLEDDEALGGLMTLGELNFLDMNYGPEKEILTQGIFQEFFEEMDNAFDIEEAKEYFLRLVGNEKKLSLKLGAELIDPLLEGNTLAGVRVKDKETGEIEEFYGKRIIDATADADLAAAAGVPYTVGAEDYGQPGKIMAVTLVFRVKGVNWPQVFIHNNFSRVASKLKAGWGDPNAGATRKVAWGYGEQALKYAPKDEMLSFRGPNLARQKDGSVLINALLLFGVDGLDPDSKEEGIKRGKEEIPHIIEFMREEFPGFAKVELVDTAEQLYVRETRHIQGEYRLTITDVLENRDHWDRIAHGSYPVDVQQTGPGDLGNVIGKPAIYSIPFRCLVPLKVDNLLVVGRSASYDSLPHGSARVIPVGMATGEAAGVACAYGIENEMTFREMTSSREAVGWIQERLKEQGAYLIEYEAPRPEVMEHWAYPGVKVMRELGLAAGGYSNDYRLEAPVFCWDADYHLQQVIERLVNLKAGGMEGTEESRDIRGTGITLQNVKFPENLTRGMFLVGLARALGEEAETPQEALEVLREQGITPGMPEELLQDVDGQATFGELYVLLSNIIEQMR